MNTIDKVLMDIMDNVLMIIGILLILYTIFGANIARKCGDTVKVITTIYYAILCIVLACTIVAIPLALRSFMAVSRYIWVTD